MCLDECLRLKCRSKESEEQPSEAALYVAVGRAGSEVVLVVDLVDEA